MQNMMLVQLLIYCLSFRNFFLFLLNFWSLLLLFFLRHCLFQITQHRVSFSLTDRLFWLLWFFCDPFRCLTRCLRLISFIRLLWFTFFRTSSSRLLLKLFLNLILLYFPFDLLLLLSFLIISILTRLPIIKSFNHFRLLNSIILPSRNSFLLRLLLFPRVNNKRCLWLNSRWLLFLFSRTFNLHSSKEVRLSWRFISPSCSHF